MRLIGNKTRLLPEIEAFLRARGVTGGTLLDVFAGTASVARHFRGLGFRVHGNDLLAASYVAQRVHLATARWPSLPGVLADRDVRAWLGSREGRAAVDEGGGEPVEGSIGGGSTGPGSSQAAPLRRVVAYLDALPPRRGLVARQYAEGGAAGRLFFSCENGGRIDAVHERLLTWWRAGSLTEAELYVLLAALLEAADRVANISGTYGAFLKRLQPNAREPLRLRPPALDVRSPAGVAHRADGNALVRALDVDVLYVDPPYNHRQYAKNYHVLEVLAELHQVDDVAAYEASIYGKTGLRAYEDRLSRYCRARSRCGRPSPCEEAFADLVAAARAEHVVVSYSEEGILDREQIGRALARAAGAPRFDFARDFVEVTHRRFRSDADARRRYRVLSGRRRDELREWLFYVRKPARASRLRRSARRAGA